MPWVPRGSHWAKANLQEVVGLRECGWAGLPLPPVFTEGKLKITGANREDPAATPVVTSLGLPNRNTEPQIPRPHPLGAFTAPVEDSTPASPITAITQSPSTSVSGLFDFTVADTSDDGSPIDPTIPSTSDNGPPTDPTAAAPHETFYLRDGNIEVLCENTLFRVHTSTLSFHSPALHRTLVEANLATAESPNGCPRILSSDTAKDFTTLLKIVYLPEFVTLSTCR